MNESRQCEPACDFCGLPVAAAAPSAESLYCCWGCRIAAGVSQAHGAEGAARWMLARIGLSVFFTMNVMVFTLALWSHAEYSEAPATAALFDLFRYLCLLFTLPVLFLLGRPLLENALDDLARRCPTADMLLVTGVLAAFGFSLRSLWLGSGHVYFEVCCMVPLAVALGRWLEAGGKLHATEALRALQQLLPEVVSVRREGHWIAHPLKDVVRGDCVRFLPGQRIAIDGAVLEGRTTVDEQLLTGESAPIAKRAGDAVRSGTLNLEVEICVEASGTAAAGFLQQIVDAVIAAVGRKSRYTRLADRIASWFLLFVLVAASAAFAVQAPLRGWEPATLAALSIVLIACPCALGLATPLALWAAVGRASQAQIVVRDGDALSRLAAARAVCFDKTGTLTTGRPRVVHSRFLAGAAESELLASAGALAEGSLHPYSQALVRFVESRGVLPQAPAHSARQLPGLGMEAGEGADTALLGSARLFREQAWEDPEGLLEGAVYSAPAEREPRSYLYFGRGGRVLACFAIEEEVRAEAAPAIAELRGLGLAMKILTGDRNPRVRAVAASLQVEAEGELLPQEKLDRVQQMQQHRVGVVMVGDGINDSPALAAARVGIALGCGADVARQSADICLLTDDLGRLPWLIELARRTENTIRWNLVWALGYNTIGIGLAAVGWLHPVIAAVAMAGSSFLVIGNSLRLAALPGPGLPAADSNHTGAIAPLKGEAPKMQTGSAA